MLMSELAHMRKLYNDIIYFVQNHVKPVTPSNSYPSSLVLSSNTNMKHYEQDLGVYKSQHVHGLTTMNNNNNINNVVGVDDNVNVNVSRSTKLFGVPLLSKKRLHPDTMMENHKQRLVLENDDLGLNLMPPSPC